MDDLNKVADPADAARTDVRPAGATADLLDVAGGAIDWAEPQTLERLTQRIADALGVDLVLIARVNEPVLPPPATVVKASTVRRAMQFEAADAGDIVVACCTDGFVRLSRGAACLTARLVSAANASDAMIRISITDNGSGIDPQLMPRLGRAFERAGGDDWHVSRANCGMGLGLAISRSLAEAQGGALRIHSGLGIGTTVEIMLIGWRRKQPVRGRLAWDVSR